jgi:hypothetical protein
MMTDKNHSPEELDINDFSIMELEDRLEFLDKSNPNCGCLPNITATPGA